MTARSQPAIRSVPVVASEDRAKSRLATLQRDRRLETMFEVGEEFSKIYLAESCTLKELRRLLPAQTANVSVTTVWRAIRVYNICRRAPWILNAKYLTTTHLYAVLAVNSCRQEGLLRLAEEQAWSARKLRDAVERAGTPTLRASSACQQIVRTLRQFVKQGGALLLEAQEEEAPVDPTICCALTDLVDQARGLCAQLSQLSDLYDQADAPPASRTLP